ncbi:hypothetical protein VULLAG_LOCUS22556 [Vulpes lagopus]
MLCGHRSPGLLLCAIGLRDHRVRNGSRRRASLLGLQESPRYIPRAIGLLISGHLMLTRDFEWTRSGKEL